MNLEKKRVLVVGGGKSGVAAANLLAEVKACPVLYDANKDIDTQKLRARLEYPKETGILLGEISEEERESVELVVLSPGVPVDSEIPASFAERGVPVWGEVELAFSFSKGALLAVTGTNGKTTTTALLGRIMEEAFEDVHVVGNIGNPYTEIALKTTPKTVTVAEISSFQLETVHTFKPGVAAILNITPDHLDRHDTFENYAAMKERIAMNQTMEDTLVLNYDDENTRKIGLRTRAQVLYFSRKQRLDRGIYLADKKICYSDGNTEYPVLRTDEMKLLGSHNEENVMAAVGMALSFGVSLESIVRAVKAFEAVEHRIEFVAEIGGVAYYNDSKGTNPDAAIKGIQAMERPTVLLGGGYDKQAGYDGWIEAFDGKVKCLILLGQTREAIAQCAVRHGFQNIVFADDLREAVERAAQAAGPGDAVLLSPACASWGMFKNYEERGRMFKEYVLGLKEE